MARRETDGKVEMVGNACLHSGRIRAVYPPAPEVALDPMPTSLATQQAPSGSSRVQPVAYG